MEGSAMKVVYTVFSVFPRRKPWQNSHFDGDGGGDA